MSPAYHPDPIDPPTRRDILINENYDGGPRPRPGWGFFKHDGTPGSTCTRCTPTEVPGPVPAEDPRYLGGRIDRTGQRHHPLAHQPGCPWTTFGDDIPVPSR